MSTARHHNDPILPLFFILPRRSGVQTHVNLLKKHYVKYLCHKEDLKRQILLSKVEFAIVSDYLALQKNFTLSVVLVEELIAFFHYVH